MIADLGLGSNLGDRFGHLQGAVDGLAAAGCRIVAVSRVYETAPVGGPEQSPYLNAAVSVETSLDPYDLLALAQRLEAQAGRARTVRWGPRTLDVDILRYADLTLDDAALTLPHPRMADRAFVLVPLHDIDPAVDVAGVDASGVALTVHVLSAMGV